MHLHRLLFFAASAAAALAVALLVPPIHQDQAYHHFAGGSTFWNVLSNLPFLAIGFYFTPRTRGAWRVVSLAAILIAFGSGYYHAAPSDATLYWDRLPMTLAFMAVFAAVIHDRLQSQLLIPLLLTGLASVEVWRQTGDLRFYGFIQFFPAVAIPCLLTALPPRNLPNQPFYLMGLFYVIAKMLEASDAIIYQSTAHLLAGHPLKHLAAAAALYFPLRKIDGTCL